MSTTIGARLTATAIVLATAASTAFGAEEPHGQAAAHGGGGDVNPVAFNWVPFVASIVIFGAAFFILAKLVWPKLLTGLEEREKKIRDEIAAAEEARKQAQQAQEEYARELANARAEAQKMIEQTKAEQSRLAADLRQKSEAEMSQMRENAMRSIEAAKRAALDEIYAEMATLSTRIASKILEREVNEDDQRRLVEETVSQYTNQRQAEQVGA